MASSELTQGYSCDFLDSVSDDFCCKKSSLVARKLWSAEDKEEKQLIEQVVEEQQKILKSQEQKLDEQEQKKIMDQEQKMKDQEQKMKDLEQKIKGLEQKTKDQEQSMQQLSSLVQDQDKKQEVECGRLEQKLREQQLTLLYLYHGQNNDRMRYFLMANFSKEKALDKYNDLWSPAMYTHDGGYKFCIGVDANGYRGGHGKAIRVSWKLMEGEYDDQLKWPAKARITLELVNQDGGMNLAHTALFNLEKKNAIAYLFSRITFGSEGHFVKHSELDPFLVYDTLIFYISNITMI